MKAKRLLYSLCFTFILLHTSSAIAVTVTRGPYLQMGTPSSMIVVWRTSSSSDALVRYGTSRTSMNQTAQRSSRKKQHEIKITGLKANTKYYYSVGNASKQLAGNSSEHFFWTSPIKGKAHPFRFWIVGDSGTGGRAQKKVRDVMLKYTANNRPQIYLHMGDMAYGSGTDREFQNTFFNIYQAILRNTVVWPTIGNHEGYSSRSGPQSGPYYDAYVLPKSAEAGGLASGTEAYYSFDHANVHFIVLDSYDTNRKPTGAMLKWLKNDLNSTRQTWIIAFWHHPPYTKGSHDSDTERHLIDMRKYALPILEAAGVDLVLSGHSHIYERSYLLHKAYNTPTTTAGKIIDKGDGKISGNGPYIKNNTTQTKGAVYVVAGHGGTGTSQRGTHPVMYFTEKKNGSCIVDVNGKILTLQNIRMDGKISDRFTIIKGNALLVSIPKQRKIYLVGKSIKITWKAFGKVVKSVSIDYSINNGSSWQAITKNIPNKGFYLWKLPSTASKQVLVRVTDAHNQSFSGTSSPSFEMSYKETFKAIPYKSIWKYFDSGRDLGQSWLARSFNDSGWLSGAGQLGYGERDQATTLKRPSPRHPSVYFRKKIKLSALPSKAQLSMLHDDGIAVWINGKFVCSKYCKKGLKYSDWASTSSSDNQISQFTIPLATKNPFVIGENVIAVMIKQVNRSSSDISFDLELTVTTGLGSPQIAKVPNKQITENKTLRFQLKASHPNNLTLRYSAKNMPSGASLTTQTGVFSWRPQQGQSGTYRVHFTVTDSLNKTATTLVQIHVLPLPKPEPKPEPQPEPKPEPKPEPAAFEVNFKTEPTPKQEQHKEPAAPQKEEKAHSDGGTTSPSRPDKKASARDSNKPAPKTPEKQVTPEAKSQDPNSTQRKSDKNASSDLLVINFGEKEDPQGCGCQTNPNSKSRFVILLFGFLFLLLYRFKKA